MRGEDISMTNHDEEHTNPGRIHPTGDFAQDGESEGTEEVTQVDKPGDLLNIGTSDPEPDELDENPFDTLDGPTVVPG
jgi:hypothetical protein